MEFLRTLVSIPLMLGDAIWAWLTRDEFDDFIADQRRRFLEMTDGE